MALLRRGPGAADPGADGLLRGIDRHLDAHAAAAAGELDVRAQRGPAVGGDPGDAAVEHLGAPAVADGGGPAVGARLALAVVEGDRQLELRAVLVHPFGDLRGVGEGELGVALVAALEARVA